jgi:hypothetical protein
VRKIRLPLRRGGERGQSMIELALTFPLLLLILAGAIEIGMYYNTYLTLVDATREGARFSANGDYENGDLNDTCGETLDFYKQAACLVLQNMHGVEYQPDRDDIIVSVVQIKDGTIYNRFVDPLRTPGEQGWSYCESMLHGSGCTRAVSRFPNSVIQARIDEFSGATSAPKAAYVIVEIYHVHHQFLGLIPPGLSFLPQEVVMHAYSIMPVPSAASAIPD